MWSSCPWVSTMATTSSSRSRIEVKSGRITSIPGWWSSGKRTPQSTTSSLPWYSKTVMLRPISPSPPRGVTRRTPRARRGGDFRFLVWAGCTRSILPESGPIGPGQRTSEGGPARRHTLRTSCVRQRRRPPDPKVRRASDPRSRCSGGRSRCHLSVQQTHMVVVADAGMLSAGNLNALEDVGFSFVVGSRISKAPYDLAEHFTRHGDCFADGQILESARVMGTGKAARPRRVIYQYKFTRYSHDNRAINAMVTRAEKITTGATPMAKARFVKVTGATKELDQGLIDRARQLAGLKGYVTNLPATTIHGQGVIDAYHDLYPVSYSFRMAKSDLRARPVFHHDRDAIEAHLIVVFAALAIARELQAATGVSLKKLVQTLRPLRTVTIDIDGHTITAKPQLSADAEQILAKLPPIAG